MKIDVREAAILRGERFYRTGEPCRRGHMSDRYASTGNCVECMKEYAADKRNVYVSAKSFAHHSRMGNPKLFARPVPIRAHDRFHQLQKAYTSGDPAWLADVDAAIEALLSTGKDPVTGKPFA